MNVKKTIKVCLKKNFNSSDLVHICLELQKIERYYWGGGEVGEAHAKYQYRQHQHHHPYHDLGEVHSQ